MMTKIRNTKYEIRNTRKGFTLVELLVVMAVTLVIGTIISIILTSSLRGANKANAIDAVTKNGNTAITEIENSLRYSQGFNGVAITVGDPLSVTCNSAVTYKTVGVTSYDGGTTIYSCDSNTISSNSASLIDTNAVWLDTCFFTCTSSVTNAPIIGVTFALSKNVGVTTVFENKVNPILFQTSVEMRNITR